MRFTNVITAVDSHAEGMPSRVVTGGFPPLPGKSISEKVKFLSANLDHMRTMLLFEPRGHAAMSVVLVVPATVPEADVGIIILEPQGAVPMSGSNTIAACTVLVETGIIEAREPVTELTLDTLGGLVRVKVKVENGSAKSVTFQNVPSFSYLRDVEVKSSKFGTLTVDIAYGGMYYIMVRAKDVGLSMDRGELDRIIEYGEIIRADVKEQIEIKHPLVSDDEQRFFGGTVQVQFYGPPTHPEADMKNVVIMPPSSIDRSPCGTGTCAKLADLYAKGRIKLNEELVNESYIGTLFRGRVVEEAQVGDYPAIIPELTGSAWITGMHQFVVDPEDPLKDGFLIS